MIETVCGCGWRWERAETATEPKVACEQCGKGMVIACAEPLPDGAGAGDFDAYLEITKGPDGVGNRFFLGGVVDIFVGKQEACSVRLAGGKMVSRQHCFISRVDFGPSRWQVSDNKSTNGLFVNGDRTDVGELQDGDTLRVGEYELRYGHVGSDAGGALEDPSSLEELADDFGELAPVVHTPPAYVPPVRTPGSGGGGGTATLPRIGNVPGAHALPADGDPCPSCEQRLPKSAKICVSCGIKVDTGRPVILSAGDEDLIHGNAFTFIRIASWVMPLTIFPMPLASEAYGKHKPYATWGIVGLTTVVSLLFFIASWGKVNEPAPGQNLMLWPPNPAPLTLKDLGITPFEMRQAINDFDEEEQKQFDAIKEKLRGKVPEGQLDYKAFEEFVRPHLEARQAEMGEFHPYQLVTHALLHDTSSIRDFILHLLGNMVFLLCFGGRINAVLGNIAMVILYPILAIAAAGAHLAMGNPHGPMLGASGAVFGFAGMYLILFPIHQVYCGMWLRIWFRFRTWLWHKVFTLRGFWVLLFYFGYDALMVLLKVGDGTAHWAHIGGFIVGVVLSLGILASRLMNCGGGDILSVTLGRHAWPLIGRPSRWNRELVTA